MVRKTIIILLCLFLSVNICYAGDVSVGIEQYKNGEYEKCIDTMKAIVKDDPTVAVGYYYLGMAYSKTGKKVLAIQNYNKVINLNSDKALTELAKQGKTLVGGKSVTAIESQIEDIEEEYNPIYNDSSTNNPEIKAEEKIPQTTKVIKASDYTNNSQSTKPNNNSQPTNDEIVNAIRILQKAGLLQNGVSGLTGVNGNQVPMDPRAQQMQSMLMMMNGNNNNNNGMMNMMPYMNNGGKVDPQLMQMMLMNQMMPNFSGGGNNGNGY